MSTLREIPDSRAPVAPAHPANPAYDVQEGRGGPDVPGAPTMTMTFAVLGDGAWGTSIALLLARDPAHRVRLWSARAENGRLLRERRENVHLLPGIPIPPAVELTT